jgi:hypothetical protein
MSLKGLSVSRIDSCLISAMAGFVALLTLSPVDPPACPGAFMADSIKPAGVVVDAALLFRATGYMLTGNRDPPSKEMTAYLDSKCPTGRKNRVDTESSFPFESRN